VWLKLRPRERPPFEFLVDKGHGRGSPSGGESAQSEALHRGEIAREHRREFLRAASDKLARGRQLCADANGAEGDTFEVVAEEISMLLRIAAPQGKIILLGQKRLVRFIPMTDIDHDDAKAGLGERPRGVDR